MLSDVSANTAAAIFKENMYWLVIFGRLMHGPQRAADYVKENVSRRIFGLKSDEVTKG
jgi:hypothetical protein